MNFFKLYKNIVFLLPAETAHHLALWILKNRLILPAIQFNHPSLNTKIAGIDFKNPVGLAAGFDKNANAIKALSKHNFGFLEAGTVTPLPQDGNPKPRLFRLSEDEAIINRMGFNNIGAIEFKKNYLKHRNINIPVGINIGKNKLTESETEDYLKLIEFFQNIGSYITINISSPNTPNLRAIQKKEVLEDFILQLTEKRSQLGSKKLFLKIAPDVSDSELNDICKIALKYNIDALIINNTTITRPESLRSKHKEEAGGLSGKPLLKTSNQKIANAYKILKGQIPIIGVGGISSAEDAYEKIKSGASLVQIYSALIYKGLYLTTEINKGLVKLLEKDGYSNISEAVGSALSGNQI